MITNPKNFFEQIQNFVEEVALKIKAINGSISSFLTKADAEATYLEKAEASNTYLGKDEKAASATVADSATSANKATNDANGNNISSTYATIASLTTTNTNVTNAQTTANQAKTSADASLKSKQDVVNALGYTPLESAPVTSVDGQTGAVDLSNAYQPKGNYLTSAPVTSVNGMTGAVKIDVGGTSAYKIPYATSSTSPITKAKVATITNGVSLSLEVGAVVAIKFSNGLYGDEYDDDYVFTTLNVNGTGVKNVKTFEVHSGGGWKQGANVYLFVYDGTYWCLMTPGRNWSTYESGGSD